VLQWITNFGSGTVHLPEWSRLGVRPCRSFCTLRFWLDRRRRRQVRPAIALWLGWSHLLDFAVTTAVFGGILALTVLALRRTMSPAAAHVGRRFPCLRDPDAGVPFAVALGAAALAIYPGGVLIGPVGG